MAEGTTTTKNKAKRASPSRAKAAPAASPKAPKQLAAQPAAASIGNTTAMPAGTRRQLETAFRNIGQALGKDLSKLEAA